MKVCISNRFKNKDGSTMLLMVMIIAAVIMLGTTLLGITMSQYKIRKSNSDIRRAFYLSETGINEAYLDFYDLINIASNKALLKAEEHLSLNPDDITGAINIFKSNYKQYVINNALSYINNNGNPKIKVVTDSLYFTNEKLNIKVSSKYISSGGIEKTIAADIIILIPDFVEAMSGNMDYFKLLDMTNFNI